MVSHVSLLRGFKLSSFKKIYRMTTESSMSSAKGDLGAMRKPYNGKHATFTEADLIAKDPIEQFQSWFEIACQTPTILEANAMCLSTASKTGKPSARYVLLKGYDKEGFRFFTNYSSRKGNELAQSQPIPSRQTLIDAEEKLLKEYVDENIPIPRPENWGGYIVVPEVMEFWQGQSTRIHDRIRFRKPVSSAEPDGALTHQGGQGWIYERLAP